MRCRPCREAGAAGGKRLRSPFPQLTALGPGRKVSPSTSGQALAHRPIYLSRRPSIIAASGAIPRQPAALNRLALKAVVEPHASQVLWYVDGKPFALSDPDQAVLWPMAPGAHRFQVRLPLQKGASRIVRVVIE